MERKRNIFLLALGLITLLLSGCSQPQTCETCALNLDLLISVDKMPSPNTWTEYGPNNFGIDQERTPDLINIAFFSDLYPTNLGTVETVYRYQTIQESKADFNYSYNKYGDGYFPEGWTFSSEKADESFLSCKENSTIDFPLCRWVARYDCFVVEFSSWLITDRISLGDMENIVREIDRKASDLIPDNY